MNCLLKSALIPFLGFVLLANMLVSAQTTPTPPPPDEEEEVIKVESRLVIVPVSVVGPDGEPVLGLRADNFSIREENQPQVIESLGDAEKVPLEIVLLFDISASTDAMFKFELETAAQFLKTVMRVEDRATIYTIGAKPVLLQSRGTAEKSIELVRSIVPTKEFTAFYDSVSSAAEILQTNAPAGTRRVVLVISDGEDTNSLRIAKAIQDGYRKAGESLNSLDNKALYQLTVKNRDTAAALERERVLRLLQNADTVFYSINPAGSSYQLNKMSLFGQATMQKFADDTGGTAFLPKFQPIELKDALANASNMKRNAATLELIFKRLTNELRAQYLVQYYSDNEFPQGRYVNLKVALKAPGNAIVRARQGYYVKN